MRREERERRFYRRRAANGEKAKQSMQSCRRGVLQKLCGVHGQKPHKSYSETSSAHGEKSAIYTIKISIVQQKTF